MLVTNINYVEERFMTNKGKNFYFQQLLKLTLVAFIFNDPALHHLKCILNFSQKALIKCYDLLKKDLFQLNSI